MFGKIFKKLFGISKKDVDLEKTRTAFHEKSKAFFAFLENGFGAFLKEITDVREKTKNLRETNYKIGLVHLEKGNLTDAIFRFRFIKKFWPDLFDAYYQLAYCLVLDKKYSKAKDVLEELILKNPTYDPKAKEMINYITSILNPETVSTPQSQNNDA